MFDSFRQDLRYAVRGLRAKPGFTFAVVLTLGWASVRTRRCSHRRSPALPAAADVARPGDDAPDLLSRTRTAARNSTARALRSRATSTSPARRTRSRTLRAVHLARSRHRRGRRGARDARRRGERSFFGFFDAPPAIGRYFTAAEDSTPTGTPVAVLSLQLLADPVWRTTRRARPRFADRPARVHRHRRRAARVRRALARPAAHCVHPDQFVRGEPERIPRAGADVVGNVQLDLVRSLAQRKPGVSLGDGQRRPHATRTCGAMRARSRRARAAYARRADEAARASPVDPLRARAQRVESREGRDLDQRRGAHRPAHRVRERREPAARARAPPPARDRRAARARRERGALLSQLLTESIAARRSSGGVAGLVVAHGGGALLRAAFLPKAAAATVVFATRARCSSPALPRSSPGCSPAWRPPCRPRRANLTSRSQDRRARGHVPPLAAPRRRCCCCRARCRSCCSSAPDSSCAASATCARSASGTTSIRSCSSNLNMRGVTLDSAQNVLLRTALLDARKGDPRRGARERSRPACRSGARGARTCTSPASTPSGKLGQFDLNARERRLLRDAGHADRPRARHHRADVAHRAARRWSSATAMAKRALAAADAIGQCVQRERRHDALHVRRRHRRGHQGAKLSADSGLYSTTYLAAQFHPDRAGCSSARAGNAATFTRDRSAARSSARCRARRTSPSRRSATSSAAQTKSWELGATMFAAFGLLALALAAIGLYSVIAYNVAQRTHEMGVRVALGAQVRDLIRLVVREGMKHSAVGLAIGAIAALVRGTWIKPLLFNESPRDPPCSARDARAAVRHGRGKLHSGATSGARGPAGGAAQRVNAEGS